VFLDGGFQITKKIKLKKKRGKDGHISIFNFQQKATNIQRMIKALDFHIWIIARFGLKSSYGRLPLWMHHKIHIKNWVGKK
jgi:hypothetical protein